MPAIRFNAKLRLRNTCQATARTPRRAMHRNLSGNKERVPSALLEPYGTRPFYADGDTNTAPDPPKHPLVRVAERAAVHVDGPRPVDLAQLGLQRRVAQAHLAHVAVGQVVGGLRLDGGLVDLAHLGGVAEGCV